MKKQYVLDIYGIEFDVLNGNYGNGVERVKNIERAGFDYKHVQSRVNALAAFMLDTEIIAHQVFRWADSVQIVITCKKRDMRRFIDNANSCLHGMRFVVKRKPYSQRNFIYLEGNDEENLRTED